MIGEPKPCEFTRAFFHQHHTDTMKTECLLIRLLPIVPPCCFRLDFPTRASSSVPLSLSPSLALPRHSRQRRRFAGAFGTRRRRDAAATSGLPAAGVDESAHGFRQEGPAAQHARQDDRGLCPPRVGVKTSCARKCFNFDFSPSTYFGARI